MRTRNLRPGVCVSLAWLALGVGCDWRKFDTIKGHTPVLSTKASDGFGPPDDFGHYMLPLSVAGAAGGRFLVSAASTAALALVTIDAHGDASNQNKSDQLFGTTPPVFPITALAEVPGGNKVLLGAHQAGTVGRGSVYVMSLGAGLPVSLLDAPDDDDNFGLAVGAGALTGGAAPDFVVLSATQLTVYPDGEPGQKVVAAIDAACPIEQMTTALAPRDRANRAMLVSDLTGAGAPQIIVGTPGRSGPGVVSVFTVDATTGAATCAFSYKNDSARFGRSLATGDFDADGKPDLLVGSPPDGAFWIRGPLTATSPVLPVTLAKGAASVDLGFAVGAGDVDGAPGDEALVGDPDATVGTTMLAGEVRVVGGAMLDHEQPVVRRHDPATGDSFGTQVATLPFCKAAGCGAAAQPLLLVGSGTHVFTYFVLDANDKDPRAP